MHRQAEEFCTFRHHYLTNQHIVVVVKLAYRLELLHGNIRILMDVKIFYKSCGDTFKVKMARLN